MIEKDSFGIYKRMGLLLIEEAEKLGCTWVEISGIVENLEEFVIESTGMKHNTGHLPYYIDLRPYVQQED